MKLEKKQIINLLKILPCSKNESAWNRGIRMYVVKLLEELPDDYYFACENASEVEQTLEELRKIMINGANTWLEYSENGRALLQAYFLIKNVIRDFAHQYYK